MTDTQQGQLFAVATTFLWATSALSFEFASKRVGSLVVNLLRLCIAVILLGIICYFRRGMFWPGDANQHVWIGMALSGFVGFFLCDMCLFRSYVLHGARRSALIMATAPIWAAGFDLFMPNHKVLTWIGYLGMTLTLGGVAWVILERGEGDEHPHTRRDKRNGAILSLIAACGQALGAVIAQWAMTMPSAAAQNPAMQGATLPSDQYDAMASTFIRCFAAMICFAILLTVTGWMGKVGRAFSDRKAMAVLHLGAVAGPVLGVTAFMAALQRLPSSLLQTIVATLPIVMLPAAYFLRSERITARAVLGAGVAVAGVILLCQWGTQNT